MPWQEWPVVEEGHHRVLLQHHRGGDPSGDDIVKHAAGHLST
jgi:hypothetical protein